MALELRRKTHESIVYIDKDSAPRPPTEHGNVEIQ